MTPLKLVPVQECGEECNAPQNGVANFMTEFLVEPCLCGSIGCIPSVTVWIWIAGLTEHPAKYFQSGSYELGINGWYKVQLRARRQLPGGDLTIGSNPLLTARTHHYSPSRNLPKEQ